MHWILEFKLKTQQLEVLHKAAKSVAGSISFVSIPSSSRDLTKLICQERLNEMICVYGGVRLLRETRNKDFLSILCKDNPASCRTSKSHLRRAK